jgi:hypothetical protein
MEEEPKIWKAAKTYNKNVDVQDQLLSKESDLVDDAHSRTHVTDRDRRIISAARKRHK